MTFSTDDPAEAFRAAVQSLLDGNAPNGILPAHVGGYGQQLGQLYDAHAAGGLPAVKRLASTFARADKGIAQILAGSAPERPAKLNVSYCPPLPESALEVYQHLGPCGLWLEEYVTYATTAAPMTPRLFHEAAGLFAASMAVARRLYCLHGTKHLYPNLYFLFVSPSTIDHKSTGLHVLQSIIRDAGISHLLMPRKATPSALVADLDYGKLPTPRQMLDKDFYLLRRAFAAQRGWIRDEASALFASLKQEYNAGLLELILDLYDCPDEYDELTISRNETKIERAYLSFFGVSTPIEMAPHFANLNYWTNGLWARCLVLTPDDRPREFHFFPQEVPAAGSVITGLQRMYRLLPQPIAALEALEHDNGKQEQVVRLTRVVYPHPVVLEDGVWQAWEKYAHATTHTLLLERAIEEELYSTYGRLGDLAMKVAMLLAVMDTEQIPITVGLRHFATAQQRVEGWRSSLHRLWSNQSATSETRLMERMMKKIDRAGATGMTVRDLCIGLRQTAKEVSEALTLLNKAGKVINEQMRAANGRSVEVWRCP